MSFTKIYQKAYQLYTFEIILRNICVAAAMVNVIARENHMVIAFFLLGLIAQLHPGMFTYIKIVTKHQPDFFEELELQTQQLSEELAELQDLEQQGETAENINVEAEIDHRDRQMNFIKTLS